MGPLDVLLEGLRGLGGERGEGGSFSLSATYLQNKCQRNSGMHVIFMTLGLNAEQKKWLENLRVLH